VEQDATGLGAQPWRSEAATIATSPMVRLRLGIDKRHASLSIQGLDAKRADLVPLTNPSLRKPMSDGFPCDLVIDW